MKARRLLFIAFLCNSVASVAAAPAIASIDLRVSGRHAEAGGYTFDLGEPDNGNAPVAWEGPIVIVSPGGKSCRVSWDVNIIERPIKLLQRRLLYVATYGGSERRFFVVSLASCAIIWRSPVYYGPSEIRGDRLLLYGLRPFRIGENGIPER